MLIRVTETNTALWNKASEVSKLKYNSAYNASIDPAPQYYVVVQNAKDRILACAGITFGEEGGLFSEQYLDKPIEAILRARLGKELERSNIAEIGSLTSHHATAGMILVNMIPMLAWCMGAHYLLCTVTPQVIRMMEGCQIAFEPLEQADPDRLTEAKELWGSYYDRVPVTGFIRVDPKRSRFAAITVETVFTHTPLAKPKRIS
ncbi:MAG: thermostable hemolysin [Marinobacter sp.]|uniref:thermostable hemolysin n=1 Tax=Marinobacter sp. AC-23 TaxID=1879031 RepID=UPI0008DD5D9F|nr:thermostable hemolysin [Marinobacter sp. AC-23]OHY80024.1 thermostable hemolysin [Marinobacter sp. AC-23]